MEKKYEGWTRSKVVPDTGAEVSVCPEDMAPGYALRATEASKAGGVFGSASGHEIPNVGEFNLPMQSDEGPWTKQNWQVGRGITRPLMSVAQECDKGNLVVFGSSGGAIFSLAGDGVIRFPRVGGTYEISMWLPPVKAVNEMATGFGWPGM